MWEGGNRIINVDIKVRFSLEMKFFTFGRAETWVGQDPANI